MIRLAQLLCPQRHCICALAYDPAGTAHTDDGWSNADDWAAFQLGLAFKPNSPLDALCGICGATELFIEFGDTIYHTMQEAEPHLRKCEADQAATPAMARTPTPMNKAERVPESIEDGWKFFAGKVLPPNASPVQFHEMRRAWYAGVTWLFDYTMHSLDPGVEPTEADLAKIQAIEDQLKAYLAELYLESMQRRASQRDNN